MDYEQELEMRELLGKFTREQIAKMLTALKGWNEETVETLPVALLSLFS